MMMRFQEENGPFQLKFGLQPNNQPIWSWMNQLMCENECERTHTLTTTTTGSKNSKKEANNQTSNQNSVLCPPKVPSLQIFGLG